MKEYHCVFPKQHRAAWKWSSESSQRASGACSYIKDASLDSCGLLFLGFIFWNSFTLLIYTFAPVNFDLLQFLPLCCQLASQSPPTSIARHDKYFDFVSFSKCLAQSEILAISTTTTAMTMTNHSPQSRAPLIHQLTVRRIPYTSQALLLPRVWWVHRLPQETSQRKHLLWPMTVEQDLIQEAATLPMPPPKRGAGKEKQ